MPSLIQREADPLYAELRPWLTRAMSLIRMRIGDARAQAQTGRGDAAFSRLNELEARLIREIKDARVAFTRVAFLRHGRNLNPEFHRTDIHYDHASGQQMREVKPRGQAIEDVIGNGIRRAKDSLRSTANVAALPGRGLAELVSDLDGWEQAAVGQLTSMARSLLSDSQIMIDSVVMRLFVRGDKR